MCWQIWGRTWVSQSSSLTALSVTCRSISWVQILSFVSRRTSFLMASSTVAMDSVLSIMNVERCWGENSELYNWGVTVFFFFLQLLQPKCLFLTLHSAESVPPPCELLFRLICYQNCSIASSTALHATAASLWLPGHTAVNGETRDTVQRLKRWLWLPTSAPPLLQSEGPIDLLTTEFPETRCRSKRLTSVSTFISAHKNNTP